MSRRVKTILARHLAVYFAENGVVTANEFNKRTDRPHNITAGLVMRNFRSWTALLSTIERQYPELWEMANKPDVSIGTTSKQDPLAALRASTTEK